MTDSAEQQKSEWIAANDAFLRLNIEVRDPVAAKAILAEYLRDGMLKARAEAIWLTTEASLQSAWKSEKDSEVVERDVEVPVRYWRSDKRAIDDRAQWRWPYNKFFYTVTLKPIKRRMMRGVEFAIADLAKLRPDVFEVFNKPKPGRRPDTVARDAGWMEVVRLSQEGSLNSERFNTIAALTAELEHRLRLPSEKLRLGLLQIKDIARQVVPVLKEPKDP